MMGLRQNISALETSAGSMCTFSLDPAGPKPKLKCFMEGHSTVAAKYQPVLFPPPRILDMSSDVRPAAELGQTELALVAVLQRGVSKLASPSSSHASRLAALKRIATVLVAAPRLVWRRTQDVPGCNVTCALIGHLRLLHAQASAATSTLLSVRANARVFAPELPSRAVNALSEALHETELCLLLLPGLLLCHKYSSDLLALPGVVDLLLVFLGLFAGLRHPQALPELELPRLSQDSRVIIPPKSNLQTLSTSLVILSLQVLGPALKGRADIFSARGGEELVDQIRQQAPASEQAHNNGDAKISAALEEFLALIRHPEQGWEGTSVAPQPTTQTFRQADTCAAAEAGTILRPISAASSSETLISVPGEDFTRKSKTTVPQPAIALRSSSVGSLDDKHEIRRSRQAEMGVTRRGVGPEKQRKEDDATTSSQHATEGRMENPRQPSVPRVFPSRRAGPTSSWMGKGIEVGSRRSSVASSPGTPHARSGGLAKQSGTALRPASARSQTALPAPVERTVLPTTVRASSASPHAYHTSPLDCAKPRGPVQLAHSASPLPARGTRSAPSSSPANTAVH